MKNKYEELFESFLSVTDFRLIKYQDGFGLDDLQGGNLGNIEADRFETAADIIDRMDVYVQDYFITDTEELLEDVYDVKAPTYWCYEDLLEFARPIMENGDYKFNIDVLDMICYHIHEVNLENCNSKED